METFNYLLSYFHTQGMKINETGLQSAMRTVVRLAEINRDDLEPYPELQNTFYLPYPLVKDGSAQFFKSLSSSLLDQSPVPYTVFDSRYPEAENGLELDPVEGLIRLENGFETNELFKAKFRYFVLEDLTDEVIAILAVGAKGRIKMEKRGNVTISKNSYLEVMRERAAQKIANGDTITEITMTRESCGLVFGVDEEGNIV